jgi:uncharacterized membrane protein YedE/YeeE
MRALLGERLGVTGAWSSVIEAASRRRPGLDYRAWVFAGLIAGALVFRVAAGGPDFHGYGWLTDTFTGGSRFLVAPILVAAGVLIGYGAKLARGCTSGNGLSGTAMWSPASLAATATFFGTAIVVSFAIEAII